MKYHCSFVTTFLNMILMKSLFKDNIHSLEYHLIRRQIQRSAMQKKNLYINIIVIYYSKTLQRTHRGSLNNSFLYIKCWESILSFIKKIFLRYENEDTFFLTQFITGEKRSGIYSYNGIHNVLNLQHQRHRETINAVAPWTLKHSSRAHTHIHTLMTSQLVDKHKTLFT